QGETLHVTVELARKQKRTARSKAGRIAGALGVPSRSTLGEGHVDIAALELSMIGLPGVVEDGMPGANEQRKPGTARGSPRRSRTAKASGRSSRKLRRRCDIPRSANQHLVTRHVPFSDHRPLAPLAKAAQSEGRHDLKTDHEAGE